MAFGIFVIIWYIFPVLVLKIWQPWLQVWKDERADQLLCSDCIWPP
jgi:hypothetical protein